MLQAFLKHGKSITKSNCWQLRSFFLTALYLPTHTSNERTDNQQPAQDLNQTNKQINTVKDNNERPWSAAFSLPCFFIVILFICWRITEAALRELARLVWPRALVLEFGQR